MRLMRRSTLRSERGATAVEFALVAPIFFMMVFGIIDLARAYGTQSQLMAAARQGARFAAVQADPAGNAQAVRTVVEQASPPIGGAAITDGEVTVSLDAVAKRVTVTVTGYTLQFITPFAGTIGHPSMTLSASAELPWERGT